ncbi:conserved hypothetical protein [Hyella patelloides LEGE 07179]|uniref:Uncharacterized protein n=1 Tax=Hyella patelloides LEGE 07179 TaxID=945734 RepID=A0A563VZE5_9CYAN|nr:hypothetical protein [Hyella patelloides]VEP16633.1 conserved hypothetical protein [Hyella patelloides LEGE 07179]
MDTDRSSQIVSHSPNEPTQDRLKTQAVSVINSENTNSSNVQKWGLICLSVLLGLTVFLLFARETDVCLLSTCNDYSDSVATSTLMGNDFIAYAGGAATLLVLTALIGVPLLPAVAISTGVWFLVQMIQ